METIKMSLDKWMFKLWYNHTMEYYYIIKKNKELIYTTTQMALKGIKWKKSISKGHILYDYTDIIFSIWQSFRDGKQIRVG